MEFIPFADENDGFRYVLVCIDDFSKYAWLRALKNKDAGSVMSAFRDIFESSKRVPHRLRTDRGKEFENRTMDKFYREHDILFFVTTNSTIKASIVERVIRTFKARIYRYFTSKGNHRWVDELQNFAEGYNSSYHRSIKMSPKEASEAETSVVFRNLYEGKTLKELMEKVEKPTINEGDVVRLQYDKDKVGDKSYFTTFTDQTATVDKVIQKPMPLYSLLDYRKKEIPRHFYKHEIQSIPEPSYRINKVLRERIKNGKKQYYVSFIGYPASENSWVESLGNV